jgi:hypothetical protein
VDQDEINRRFEYHAPDEKTRNLHDQYRVLEKQYAELINELPGGETREKSLAYTKLEEMAFWVHAHIARNLH